MRSDAGCGVGTSRNPIRHRTSESVASAIYRPRIVEQLFRKMARPRGRITSYPYAAARTKGDFDTAAVIAGEAVDLITDIPPASEIVQRMVKRLQDYYPLHRTAIGWSNNGSSSANRVDGLTRQLLQRSDMFGVRDPPTRGNTGGAAG
jgi:hypothetical protein